MSFRELRAAALICIGWAGVVAMIILLSGAAFFLLGAAAAVLCLLLLVGLAAFVQTALVHSSRAEFDAELCAPEGATPPRAAASSMTKQPAGTRAFISPEDRRGGKKVC